MHEHENNECTASSRAQKKESQPAAHHISTHQQNCAIAIRRRRFLSAEHPAGHPSLVFLSPRALSRAGSGHVHGRLTRLGSCVKMPRTSFEIQRSGGRRMGELEATDRGMRPAVDATLAALPQTEVDQAARRLAQRYADQLDRASTVASLAARAARKAGDDADVQELVAALRSKLAERIAWETIGPRLLGVLESLGATPKARAAQASRTPTPKAEQGKPVNRLHAIRAKTS